MNRKCGSCGGDRFYITTSRAVKCETCDVMYGVVRDDA